MSGNAEGLLFSRNEEVSDFIVGDFNDKRLLKTGALLFKQLTHKMTACIRKLSPSRACQMAFSRFLKNEKSSMIEIEETLSKKTDKNCIGKQHVLCLQDTVEINYSSQPEKKLKLGVNRNKPKSGSRETNESSVRGFLAHPGLIMEAGSGDILGLSSIKVWTRESVINSEKKVRPIEEKESYKWLETAEAAKKNIKNAEMMTVIGDRESDIYELFDRCPDAKTHLVVRSSHNRKLTNDQSIDSFMADVEVSGEYSLELPAITGVRSSRQAQMEIKFTRIEISAPSGSKSNNNHKKIQLTCIEAREISSSCEKESPVFWRLLTTHDVESVSDAMQILTWYSWRWNIEQIFRTMKKKGLKIEECELTEPDALLKFFVLSIAAAVQVLCLVRARDGSTERPASDLFSDDELLVLACVLLKVNGKTKKQKNPYKINSLSWASWIIARLGGWMGYKSERPPGPITMYHGLEIFFNYVEGWKLAQKDMCTR